MHLEQQPPPTAQQNVQIPATNSYSDAALAKLVKKTLPPRFDGNPSKLQNWLFVMQQFLELAGIVDSNERAKFMVSQLEGKALTWWRSFTLRSPANALHTLEYDELVMGLTVEFQDVDRELKLRRRMRYLKQEGGVQGYVNAFRRLQLELGDHALDDGAALFQFLEGLRENVRTQVLLARPDTLEDAILLAERSDAALGYARGGTRGGGTGQQSSWGRQNRGASNSGYAPMDLDFVQQFGDKGASSSGAAAKKPRDDKSVCFYCGKKGHWKRDCFKYKNNQAKNKGKQQLNNAEQYPPAPPKN